MGSWGYESSASDHCWDALLAGNIHEMSQKEADQTISHLLKNKDESFHHSIFVGVVTHILYQKLHVSKKVLQSALKLCDEMLDKKHSSHNENVNNYNNIPLRIKSVKQERAAILRAIKNDGFLKKKKYVKGLLEKIIGA